MTKVKSRVLILIISLLAWGLVLPFVATPAGAEPAEAEVTLHFTIYSKEEITNLEIKEGTGFFAESYEIEQDDVTSTTPLANGLKKYEIEFLGDAADYPLGKEFPFTLVKNLRDISDTVRVKVSADAQGNPAVNAVLKEKIKARRTLSFSEVEGKAVAGIPDNFQLPLQNKNSGALQNVSVTKDATGVYFLEDISYDDAGELLPSALQPAAEAQLPLLTFRKDGGKQFYAVQKVAQVGADYQLVLKEVKLVNKTFHVHIKRPFEVLGENTKWKFAINGKLDSQAAPQLNIPLGKGDFTFDINAADVAETAALSLPQLPQKYPYYSIAEQKYDAATNTLDVTLGKKVYFLLSNIEKVNYDDFATASGKSGFVLGLYDSAGNLVEKSRTDRDPQLGVTRYYFTKVVPGEYTIKILAAAANFQENYDLSMQYQLRLQEDGSTHVKAFTAASPDKEVWINPYGGTDSRFDGSAESRAYVGYKHPYLLLVPQKAKFSKVIKNADDPAGTKQAFAARGDVIDFQLQGKIPGDHRLVLKYGKYVDLGFKNTITLVDTLDERLEMVNGTLEILEDGAPSVNYQVKYDATSRQIQLIDNEKSKVVDFNFNTKIAYRAEKNITINFQAKVKDFGNQPLFNRIPGGEVEIVPYLEILVQKKWTGGQKLLENMDMENYIDNFQIETYQGENKVRVEPVKKYLRPGSFQTLGGKDFRFVLEKLPKYAPSELTKAPADREALSYKIVENLPENLRGKFVVTQQENIDTSGIKVVEFTNTYKPPQPPPEKPPTPEEPPKPEEPPTPQLPRTGSNALLAAIAMLGLGIGGLEICRRSRQQLNK